MLHRRANYVHYLSFSCEFSHSKNPRTHSDRITSKMYELFLCLLGKRGYCVCSFVCVGFARDMGGGGVGFAA